MITMVDCALAAMVALCIGFMAGGFNRAAKREDEDQESEQKSAAKSNAGPLWVFVPNRHEQCNRSAVALCISKYAKHYAYKHRN